MPRTARFFRLILWIECVRMHSVACPFSSVLPQAVTRFEPITALVNDDSIGLIQIYAKCIIFVFLTRNLALALLRDVRIDAEKTTVFRS